LRFALFLFVIFLVRAPSGAAKAQPERRTGGEPWPSHGVDASDSHAGGLSAILKQAFSARIIHPEFSSRYGFKRSDEAVRQSRIELIAVLLSPCSLPKAMAQVANGTAEVFLGASWVVESCGEGAKPTIAASYFRRAYDGGVRRLILEVLAIHFPSWPARTLRISLRCQCHFQMEQTQDAAHRAQFGQTLFHFPPSPVGGSRYQAEIWHFTQAFPSQNAWGIFGQ